MINLYYTKEEDDCENTKIDSTYNCDTYPIQWQMSSDKFCDVE